MNKEKVFIVCSGLGAINRGYESFTRECFDSLKNNKEFEVFLYKGAGEKNENEKSLFNLKREAKLTKIVSKFIKKEAYYIEQLTFFSALLPEILIQKPSVILFSDFLIGCWLHHFRKMAGLKYKILFSNGAPNGPPFHIADLVQQLTKFQYNIAINGGEKPNKHVVLPYGIKMPDRLQILRQEQIQALRLKLSLPLNKLIILSVGAVKSVHKRMDHIINEFSKINVKDKFLLILGHIDQESEYILNLAKEKLSIEEYSIRSVKYEEIFNYYQATDIFSLASLSEGFGRVLLEAGSFGMPIIVHDTILFREILGPIGFYTNMEKEGDLQKKIEELYLQSETLHERRKEIFDFVYQNYSWENLTPLYINMINKLIQESDINK